VISHTCDEQPTPVLIKIEYSSVEIFGRKRTHWRLLIIVSFSIFLIAPVMTAFCATAIHKERNITVYTHIRCINNNDTYWNHQTWHTWQFHQSSVLKLRFEQHLAKMFTVIHDRKKNASFFRVHTLTSVGKIISSAIKNESHVVIENFKYLSCRCIEDISILTSMEWILNVHREIDI
jgi:hypothetical protein